MGVEGYHKDMLVLVFGGLIAIEMGGLLLSCSIAIALAGGADYLAEHGPTLENVMRFFVENPMALGLALLISHIFITLTRTYIVVRYSHKHGLSWHEQLKDFCQLDRTRLLRFSLVLALVLALELPTTFFFGAPQAYEEYRFYVQAGTGALGYALALAYYLAEGLWLATALELCSLRAEWGGLAVLFIAWAPFHLLRPWGIDVVNFLWALATSVMLELTRRASRNTVAVLALWMVIVLV